MSGPVSPRRAFAGFLVATLLTQLAWILAVPTYGGMDEFDHVYKAAAVARGELHSLGRAGDARGELVPVPADIVRAAHPVCERLTYTSTESCNPVDHLGDGLVTVASSASAYDPAYYLVVGTVARPFHGDAADVAMRVTTAVLCALLVAWAAALVARSSRGRWPLLALAVALTPTFLYSTAMAAPNGLTYAGGLLVWAALLAMVRTPSAVGQGGLLTAFVVGSTSLLLTHTTGPMWLALTGVVLLVLRGPVGWWRWSAGRRGPVAASLVVVALVGLAALAWTHGSGAARLGADGRPTDTLQLPALVGNQLLWVLQTVGAFPLRDQSAPLAVYALWLPLMTLLVVAVLRHGQPRHRLALALLVVLDFAVPTVLTVIAYPYVGLAWQGRYCLPLTVGLLLLGGLALDRAGRPAGVRHVSVVLVATGVASALSLVDVARGPFQREVSLPLVGHLPGGLLVLVVLAAASTLALAMTVGARRGTVPVEMPRELSEATR